MPRDSVMQVTGWGGQFGRDGPINLEKSGDDGGGREAIFDGLAAFLTHPGLIRI